LQQAAEADVELTLLVAPTSPPERIAAIARSSQGFIYLVSTVGVTGMRAKMGARVQELLYELRSVTDKPVGVGFGISQPEQAQQVMAWGADAAIVGSAFVKRLSDGTPKQGLDSIASFCRSLKAAVTAD
jgi:tryptophan synthase alpha chain